MFDANLKPCKANFAPTLVAEILSKAMNRRLSCRLRITMEINVWIELLLLCLKNATHFENVELVSMLWAKSKRVCAAGIRSVFMRYGLVVSNKDLKYSINYVNKPKKIQQLPHSWIACHSQIADQLMSWAQWQFRTIASKRFWNFGLCQLQYLWIVCKVSHRMERCKRFRLCVVELLPGCFQMVKLIGNGNLWIQSAHQNQFQCNQISVATCRCTTDQVLYLI